MTPSLPVVTEEDIPDWPSLFGSLDFCACEHCCSVYSPAAYLVDLLAFLKQTPGAASNRTAKDVLFDRRPDIGRIELSCANTNTPVPYIDLVNEILENAISPPSPDKPQPQTSGTAEELNANPQDVNVPVYDTVLKTQVYPWTLPFDLWAEEARVYLRNLGAERYQLLEATHSLASPAEGTRAAILTDPAIARAYLGMTPEEWQIITETTGRHPWEFWGYAADTEPTGWLTEVSSVPTFLQKSGLRYEQLLELLATRFLNGTNAIEIDPPTGCNLDEMTLTVASKSISSWLSLGPIYNPDHQTDTHREDDGHPTAGNIIKDIDQNSLDPIALTKLTTALKNAPSEGDTGNYGTGSQWFRDQNYSWRVASFTNPDWRNIAYIEDDVHRSLTTGTSAPNPGDPQSFAGKHHALAFFLTYISSPDARNVTLCVRSDDSIRLWLNGKELTEPLRFIGERDINEASAESCAEIGLQKGWNILLAAVAEKHAEWGFSARIKNAEGLIITTTKPTVRELKAARQGLQAEATTAVDTLLSTFFQKVVGFVRLQRKLGWTIRELDQALSALQPLQQEHGVLSLTEHFLIQVSHIEQLRARFNMPLVKLMSWWRHIDTAEYDVPGTPKAPSFYEQLFQNKTLLGSGDEIWWKFSLNNVGTLHLGEHSATLLAVLGLSDADFVALKDGTGLNDSSWLTLDNLSTLYRFALFAKTLGVSIPDFIALKVLIGMDPFEPASHRENTPASPAHTENTLLFIEKTDKIRASAFSIDQLNYLYRHQAKPTSNLIPSPASLNALTKDILAGLNKIASETTSDAPSEDLLQRKLATILETQGVSEAIAFIDSIPVDTAEKRTFVNVHFGLFLPETGPDYSKLLAPASPMSDDDKATFKAKAIDYLLEHLIPYLRDTLSRTAVKQILSNTLKLDKAVTELLLEKILKKRADSQKAAITDFLALASAGLSAEYFKQPDFTVSSLKRIDPAIDFNWGSGSPAPGIPQSFSVRWTGKLLARSSELHTFYVRTTGGVALWVKGESLIKELNNNKLGEFSSNKTIALDAGELYDIKVEYKNVPANALLQLSWSSASTPKAVIPQPQLYPNETIYTAFVQSYILLQKAGLLVRGFKMTAKEVEYLSAHGKDFADFDLNVLPLQASDFKPGSFYQWERLYDLFTFRDSLPAAEVGLTDVFAISANPAEARKKLAQATGWDAGELAALTNNDLKNEISLVRLQTVLNLSQRLGVTTAQLRDWSRKDPDRAQAQAIKNALKARYDDDQWLGAAKSLKDGLREQQRSAMVAYLTAPLPTLRQGSRGPAVKELQQRLNEAGAKPALKVDGVFGLRTYQAVGAFQKRRGLPIDGVVGPQTWLELVGPRGCRDSNALYDYFLIDVEMCACQMTSRIGQAISSVQMFTQRCLMGLEKDARLNEDLAKQWKWMKNYRVWEANRKVFLYPENWIEPELRDDKSPFFKDLENELLQNDLTLDTAETAYRNYLEKLDNVARLEICAIYPEFTNALTPEKLHVFGRTTGDEPRTYYYRQWSGASFWTPWQKVDVDIQSDHLMAVIYERRLRLFWPIFEMKTDSETAPVANTPANKYWELKLAWSECKMGTASTPGTWSPRRVSAESLPLRPAARTLAEKSEFTFYAYDASAYPDDTLGTRPLTEILPNSLYIFCFRNPPAIQPKETSRIPRASRTEHGFQERTVESQIGWLFSTGCHGDFRSIGNGWDVRMKKEEYKEYSLLDDPKFAQWFRSQQFSLEKGEPRDFNKVREFYDFLPNPPKGGRYENMMLVKDDYAADRKLSFVGYESVIPKYEYTLNTTPGRFRLVFPTARKYRGVPLGQWGLPFFYQDDNKTFFVDTNLGLTLALKWRWSTFYHPYVCEFIKQLNRYGIPGLLNPSDPQYLLRRQLFVGSHLYASDKNPASGLSQKF